MAEVFHIGKAVREKARRDAREGRQLEATKQVKDANPTPPSFIKKAWSYAKAYAKWRAAGSPVRTPEEQAAVLAICKACPLYQPHKKANRPGRCGICGCKLNINGDKVRFSTESCPADPPRWVATVGTQETPAVEAQTAQTAQKQPPSRRERRAARIAARKARTVAQDRAKELELAVRALPGGPPQKPTQAIPQANGQPPQKKNRKQERAERIERRRAGRLAMGGVTQEPVKFQPTGDPLKMYDRDGNPIGHALRDLWHGSAAFYVCGGPSLKEIDLSFLKDRGIVSLGINNVGGYAPVRAWTFSDPAEKFHHGIFLDPAIIKFVPRPKMHNRVRAKLPDGRFQWTTYDVKACPNVFGYDRETKWNAEQFLTTEWATWGPSKKHPENEGKPCVLFTFFLGLRLLHYLGVRRVYLLGADFKMDATHHYAFGQDRHPGAQASNNNSYRVASLLLRDLRPVLDRAGFEVFQTNENSGLKVFDFVPLDVAIEDCRGAIPPEPFVLDGFYEKIDPNGQPKQDPGTDDRGE